MLVDLFNSLLEMEEKERVVFVKTLSTDQLNELKKLMNLSPKISIKRLCKELEDMAIFVRLADKLMNK